MKTILTFILAATLLAANAQQNLLPVKRSTIFVELAGNGLFYSINYDRLLIAKPAWRLAGRAGMMYYRSGKSDSESTYGLWVATPLELSYLRGKKNHFLELGLGLTPLLQNAYEIPSNHEVKFWEVVPTARIGYRYQRRVGGIFYKVGFTPIAGLPSNKSYYYRDKTVFTPWFGLAIGYTLQ